MNRYLQEGHMIERYLTNIEQQNQILINILETMNRQNLSSRNLINSYANPFAPRYRDTNFNRNWNNTLSFFPPSLNRSSPVRNRDTRAFSNSFPTHNTYQRNRNRERRTRLRSQNTRATNTQRNSTQTTNATQTATNTQPNIFLQTILSMLSPVRISPSPGQIENATETYLYNSNEHRNCPIDREPINTGDSVVRIRHCGHIFRRDNIMTWFQHNPRCPLCRYDIRNYTTNNSSNNSIPVPPPPPPPPISTSLPSITPPSLQPPSITPPSLQPPSISLPSMPPPSMPPPSMPPPSMPPPSLSPPNISSPTPPLPTHNAETQFINDLSFNNVASIFNNFTNAANIDGLTENFFSNLIQNMPLDELNNLASINLDISGNTASLSFEGNVSPPPNDVD